MQPFQWLIRAGPLQSKGDREGGKEYQELIYLLLVGRTMSGEYSRCSVRICCVLLKKSENTWLGPPDFTPAADRTIYSKSTWQDGRRGSTAATSSPEFKHRATQQPNVGIKQKMGYKKDRSWKPEIFGWNSELTCPFTTY